MADTEWFPIELKRPEGAETWFIKFLSDRDGELSNEQQMPPDLMHHFYGNSTFLVRMDRVGILYEVEFGTQESDGLPNRPAAEVFADLLKFQLPITSPHIRWGAVEVGSGHIACGRAALWVFVPDTLQPEAQHQLLSAMQAAPNEYVVIL